MKSHAKALSWLMAFLSSVWRKILFGVAPDSMSCLRTDVRSAPLFTEAGTCWRPPMIQSIMCIWSVVSLRRTSAAGGCGTVPFSD